MPIRANLLSNYPGFVTRDLAQARESMSTLFGATRFEAAQNGVARSGEISVRSPSPVIPAFTPVDLEFEQYNQLVLRIEYKALKRYLGFLLGQELSKELVFHHNEANPALNSLRR